MDSSEATKHVIDRISKLEPEHIAKKIIGYMYFQGLSDHEMIRLALGPDSLIHNLITKAKNARLLASSQVISPPISPTINPTPIPEPSFQFAPFSPRPFSSPVPFRRMDPYWDHQLPVEQQPMHNSPFKMMPYSDYIGVEEPLEAINPGPSSFPNDYQFPEAAFCNLSIRGGRNSPNLGDYPVKTCHYFSKGFCKHGSNCRYYHDESFSDSFSHAFSPNSYEAAGEDQGFSPGSLEKLELEITELLRSRGGPVSIASLPMMYYDKYGKSLQAEGYLTESQRHGKAGYSLTKLLARLKNSIRLIDRPHGQHAVILAEDGAKFMDIRSERNDPGPIVSGSRQIYLTFPAESTFVEEDVSIYFSSNFGPVQDVRIPCQQKRMFGFVTFVSADTVKLVLSMDNPHFVCGSRVLVKPYREKSKPVERKYLEKFDNPAYYNSHPMDIDLDFQTNWESSRAFRRQLMEVQEHSIELETMRLSQLQLAYKPMASQSRLGYSMDGLKVPEDHPKFSSKERFNYLLDVLNSGSTSDNNPKYPVNNCGDQESAQGVTLPDSPFASAVASSISAVI